MVSTRSGRRTSTSGPRTRSQGARTGGSSRRSTSSRRAAPTRAAIIVVKFGPRKGKRTTKQCLKAGSTLKTQKTSRAGKQLRACRTNKRD